MIIIWPSVYPWRRKRQPTLVFVPGKSHGPRSLGGYSPWGRKESDTTEWLQLQLHLHESSLSLCVSTFVSWADGLSFCSLISCSALCLRELNFPASLDLWFLNRLGQWKPLVGDCFLWCQILPPPSLQSFHAKVSRVIAALSPAHTTSALGSLSPRGGNGYSESHTASSYPVQILRSSFSYVPSS